VSLIHSQRQLAVLRLVRERATLSRAEICSATGLSMSQVSRLTSDLRAHGLITVERTIGGTEGRPTELLALAGDSRYVVGLDVGGLSQQAVVLDLRGQIVASLSTSISLSLGRDALLAQVSKLVRDVLARASVPDERVLGLGVGLRAVVDPIAGVIAGGPETPRWSPAWINLPIRDELAKLFPWDLIEIDDTVRALAVAERRFGHGAGQQDFVFVLADSGIGAALMINGRPYLGPNRTAGEVGHITIDPNGEPCGCGKVGCLETIASTSALIRRSAQALSQPVESVSELDALSESGSAEASRLLDEGGVALGRGLAILHNVLASSLCVIGGQAVASERYLAAATRTAEAQSLSYLGRQLRIVRSETGPLAGATGAGTMILDAFFDPPSGVERRRGRASRSSGSLQQEEQRR
jgi:predicted NBD/HSP70 family sugar kinase